MSDAVSQYFPTAHFVADGPQSQSDPATLPSVHIVGRGAALQVLAVASQTNPASQSVDPQMHFAEDAPDGGHCGKSEHLPSAVWQYLKVI